MNEKEIIEIGKNNKEPLCFLFLKYPDLKDIFCDLQSIGMLETIDNRGVWSSVKGEFDPSFIGYGNCTVRISPDYQPEEKAEKFVEFEVVRANKAVYVLEGEWMDKCNVCNSATVLVSSYVNEWNADQEPYCDSVIQDHEGVSEDVYFYGHYCEKCAGFKEIWIESTRMTNEDHVYNPIDKVKELQKQIKDQATKIEELEKALELACEGISGSYIRGDFCKYCEKNNTEFDCLYCSEFDVANAYINKAKQGLKEK